MAGIVEMAIRRAHALGADFVLGDDGKVLVKGLSSLPEELRRTLRDNKSEVFEYIAQQSNKVEPIIWQTGNLSDPLSQLTNYALILFWKRHLYSP